MKNSIIRVMITLAALSFFTFLVIGSVSTCLLIAINRLFHGDALKSEKLHVRLFMYSLL